MRVATNQRKRTADEAGLDVGISYNWIPGSSFPGMKNWEKINSEAKKIKIEKALFADDTTVVGKKSSSGAESLVKSSPHIRIKVKG